MTKTIFWLSILAISVVLIAGSLAVSPIAVAGGDDDDDDDDDGGAAGPPGPPGATGATGPAGADGADGALNFYQKTNAGNAEFGGGITSATASCDPGDVATGGGYTIDGAKNNISTFIDRPAGTDGWIVSALNLGNQFGTIKATAHVICQDNDPSHVP